MHTADCGKHVLFGISFENSFGTSFENYVKRSIVLNVSTIGYSSVSVSTMFTEPERNYLSDSVVRDTDDTVVIGPIVCQ